MLSNLTFWQMLILLLVGLLFFKEQLPSFIWYLTGGKMGKQKIEDKEDPPAWASSLIDSQNTLKHYFNHDTTEHHVETHNLINKMLDKMDTHNKMEETNRGKLDEILKYGVPCRKE